MKSIARNAATALAILAFVCAGGAARADLTFEGLQFGNHWERDACITVSAAGMSITCPPAVNPAIGCYARIGDPEYNVPTGLRIEMESNGYAWLSVFDNCGWIFEFQPQPCCDYTFTSIRFPCYGDVVSAGHPSPWLATTQTWVFDIDTLTNDSGRLVRRLTTTAPDGSFRQDEVVMPSFYPLMGQLQFYFGAGRACTTTIKKVALRGADIVGNETTQWGAVKALFR